MHILLIHQAFAALDEPGGTRHHEMSRCLVDHGHQVTIITSPVSYLTGKSRTTKVKWLDRQLDGTGITILRTYTYSALHRSFVHRVISFLSFMVSSFVVGLGVRNVDVVWGTSPPIFQGFTAWFLSFLKRKPFLFEVRDLWPSFAIAVGVLHNPLLISASQWLERFLYERADKVIVNSPGYVDHVRQHGARDVEVIPNGVDPSMFDPDGDGSSIRQKYHLEHHYIVLYAGAHGLSNDLDIVLQAAHQLQAQQNICFILVGDGKEKKSLQEKALHMNLTNVTFLPPVPKMEMKDILSAANACIAILKPIELYKTTYPNKVFDYLAAGRPVILAIDGVIRKVVEEAQAGIAISPGSPNELASAVMTLAAHPEKGKLMGVSGRIYVEEHFNRYQQSQKLVQVLESLRKEKL